MRNPLKLTKRQRVRRKPYTQTLSFLYDYNIIDNAPTKLELKLRQRPKSDKIIKNPFQRTGFLGLKKKGGK
tara:strand:+ start:910 stop:1122 length:213 start_codon:yes stop_codon:yes gene_type:complete